MKNLDIKELTDFLDKYGVEYKVVGNRVEADTVDLAFRGITQLPDSIGNLKCNRFDVSFNQLTSLTDSICSLQCDHLYLHDNNITQLPESFWNPKCKYLDLYNNPLTSESQHLLDKLKSNGFNVIYRPTKD